MVFKVIYIFLLTSLTPCCELAPVQLTSNEISHGAMGSDEGAKFKLIEVAREKKGVAIRHTEKFQVFVAHEDSNSSDGMKIFYIHRNKKKGGGLEIDELKQIGNDYLNIKQHFTNPRLWGSDPFDALNHYDYKDGDNLLTKNNGVFKPKYKYFCLFETDNKDKDMESKQKFISYFGRVVIEEKNSVKHVYIEEPDKKQLIEKLKIKSINNYKEADIAKYIFKFTQDDLEELKLIPKADISSMPIEDIKQVKNFLDENWVIKAETPRKLIYKGDVEKLLVMKVEFGVYTILYNSAGIPTIIFYELRFQKKDWKIKEVYEDFKEKLKSKITP